MSSAVAMNCKEIEVGGVRWQGTLQWNKYLCSRRRQRPLTLQLLPVSMSRCSGATQEMEVCLIGRRHRNVSRQGTPPSEECNLYLPRKN